MILTISEVLDTLKSIITCENWYAGKSFDNDEYCICLYGNRREKGVDSQFPQLRSYGVFPLTIKIRWGKNYAIAEQKAVEVFKMLESLRIEIGTKECFFQKCNNNAIDIGSNEKGVFEFVIDTDIFYKEIKKEG